jgi:hemin uptake protein HemP
MIEIPEPIVESRVKPVTQEFPKTISSAALLGKQNQIFIVHDGQQYQLRITKLRKLILTK